MKSFKIVLALILIAFAANSHAQSVDEMKKMERPDCVDACVFKAIRAESCSSLSRCAVQCENICQRPDDVRSPRTIIVRDTVGMRIESYKLELYPDLEGRFDRVKHTTVYSLPYEDERIAAIELGFVLFNVWDEHVVTALATDVTKKKSGERKWKSSWVSRVGVFEAPRIWTAIVFISRIRYADGEIWTSDRSELSKTMRDSGLLEEDENVEEAEIMVIDV